MKAISFILVAYLFFLNAIPCCLMDNCADGLTLTAPADNHETDDPKDCSNCSPFFTCTGCSGFTISAENTSIEITPTFSSIRYTGYILSSIPDVHYDFWQPPRLG